MKKQFRKLKYIVYIIYLASKWMFRLSLGDEVGYGGERFLLCNGTSSVTWSASSLKDGKRYDIPRDKVKKVWSIKGMIRSFKSGYHFYMTSWYQIWVQNGIEDWVKNCKIW